MPVVRRIRWGFKPGAGSPLYHPLLEKLDQHVRECNRLNVTSHWHREVFRNDDGVLPLQKRYAYYWEFRLSPTEPYRIVLGDAGEVYVTWDHYHHFLQVEAVPGACPVVRPHASTYFEHGTVMEGEQKYKVALSLFQDSLEYYQQRNDQGQIARVLLAIGRMAERIKTKAGPFSNSDQDAARLYAAVGTLLGAALTQQNFQTRLHIALTQNELEAISNLQSRNPQAWAQGQKWSLVEAIEYELSHRFGKC